MNPRSMSKSHTPFEIATGRAEWKLIVACSRLRFTSAQRERVNELLEGPLDWADVIHTATRHRVETLLYSSLSNHFAAAVPTPVMRSLGDMSREWSRRALFLAYQTRYVLDNFYREGISAIPYKGPTLAALVYGNFALRHFEDLDFVLPQKEVTRALHVLEAAGFRSSLDPTVATDASFLADGRLGQYCFFSAKSNTLVELHSEKTMRYFPVPLQWEDLTRRLVPVSIGDREVHTFSIENTLLLLSVHGAKHFWERLIWLCDIAAIVQGSHQVNWELSEFQARRMGCRRMWLLALALANQVLEAPLPIPILRKIGDDSVVTALSRNVKLQLACRDEIEPGVLQRLSFRLRSHETWSQGIRQCFRFATRPTEEDHRAYKLQKWAAPLFLFLRPWRLLQGYGIGPRRK
jgi:hypothetical protein